MRKLIKKNKKSEKNIKKPIKYKVKHIDILGINDKMK